VLKRKYTTKSLQSEIRSGWNQINFIEKVEFINIRVAGVRNKEKVQNKH